MGETLAFIASMPERYRELFDAAARREHARTVTQRGQKAVHVALFGPGTTEGPGLCVVARDAPGLLAAISAALTLNGFDITRAEAFTRMTPGGGEAVDFFWVRHGSVERGPSTLEEDAAVLEVSLGEILSGRRALPSAQTNRAVAERSAADVSVRFHEHPSGSWLRLEFECSDRRGLMLAVTAALYGEGVQIIGSKIQTLGTRVHDRFDLALADGARIEGTRLRRIQLALLTALESGELPSAA